MNDPKQLSELKSLAERMVNLGRSLGADEIQVSIAEALEFNADVRLGNIENLIEAGARYCGFKIIKEKRTAYATSSDLSPDTLRRLVQNAIHRAEHANPDECAGLPAHEERPGESPPLDLCDPEIPEMETEKKIALALETERIALTDKRISNSHGASFETKEVTTILANSFGFLDDYAETFCGLGVGIQAGETDSKVEGFWSSTERHFRDLESPETIAKKAVERTVRQLHPRKIKTQAVPVIFEPPMTSWLLGFIFACISGAAVYQKLSFLSDKLGERIAGENISVVDDGRMPGKLGSRPFDSEGVSTKKNTVIENGLLRNFLCDTYSGKKLDLLTTGNADGSGVGPHNFYLLPGSLPPEAIIQNTDKGLILTRTIGHGLNPVTGDISRGAFGLWVEKGEIAYPVAEITIAGNLGKILHQIEDVGNDLEFRSTICGPTIKIQELTVAGE